MIYVFTPSQGIDHNLILENINRYRNSTFTDEDPNPYNPPLPQLHLRSDSFYFTIKELPKNVTAVKWYTLVNVSSDCHVKHHGDFVKLRNGTWVAKNDRFTWKPKQRLHAWFTYILNTTYDYPFPYEIDDIILYDRKGKRVFQDVRSRGEPGHRELPMMPFPTKASKSMKSRKVPIKTTNVSRSTTTLKQLKRGKGKKIKKEELQ